MGDDKIGEVSERLKEQVSKTCVRLCCTAGSNPALSVLFGLTVVTHETPSTFGLAFSSSRADCPNTVPTYHRPAWACAAGAVAPGAVRASGQAHPRNEACAGRERYQPNERSLRWMVSSLPPRSSRWGGGGRQVRITQLAPGRRFVKRPEECLHVSRRIEAEATEIGLKLGEMLFDVGAAANLKHLIQIELAGDFIDDAVKLLGRHEPLDRPNA